MNFCNSHVITTYDIPSMKIDSINYSPGRMDIISRCINCGGDGDDHVNGVCTPSEYAYLLNLQEIANAYFMYFLKEAEMKERKFRNEVL